MVLKKWSVLLVRVLLMCLSIVFPVNAQNLTENSRLEQLGTIIIESADNLAQLGGKVVALDNDIAVDNENKKAGKPLSIPLNKLKKDFSKLKRDVEVLNKNIKFSVEELKALKAIIPENNYIEFNSLLNEIVSENELLNNHLTRIEGLLKNLEK